MSKDGITIDAERVKAILELPLPSHKKGLQSFIGRINFVRRFMPNIAALLKPLTAMLKKNTVFNWTRQGKDSFQLLKEALSSPPTLVNPDFSKDFILYAYGSMDTIYAVLVQKNGEGFEQPITFYRRSLENYEQRYTFVEKHAYTVIKSLKKFRHMLSNNKIHLMVSHPSVKEFFLSRDLNENWQAGSPK